MHLSELKTKHVSELLDIANSMEIDGANRMRKHDLIFALLKTQAKKGESIYGEGVLEVLPDGFGFLRSPDTSYLAGMRDAGALLQVREVLVLRAGLSLPLPPFLPTKSRGICIYPNSNPNTYPSSSKSATRTKSRARTGCASTTSSSRC